jgi:hypothetical protein
LWVWRQRCGGLSKARGKALKRGFCGRFGRRGVAWQNVARAAAAWRVAGFFYMNQALTRALQTFSSRETPKKMFHGAKINVFLDPPSEVFGKKNERVIFGWKLFFKQAQSIDAIFYFHQGQLLYKKPSTYPP